MLSAITIFQNIAFKILEPKSKDFPIDIFYLNDLRKKKTPPKIALAS